MSSDAIKRFCWTNGFINAYLNTIFSESGIAGSEYSAMSFSGFLIRYFQRMDERGRGLSSWPSVNSLGKDKLLYLFHLENELWGTDYQNYINFFPNGGISSSTLLQTFLFVHGFFLIERWLDLFINSDNIKRGGRTKRRKLLFGKEGLFIKDYKPCMMIMGYPMNLSSTTREISSLVSTQPTWAMHQNIDIPDSLRSFYRANTGKDHYKTIIEIGLKNTREKLPRHILPRTKPKELRKKCSGLKATWYDAMWIYSESIRYHPVCPSEQSLRNPFYWNRTIRWLTSALVSGLFFIINKSRAGDRQLESCWEESKNLNPSLRQIFGESRDRIFESPP